MGYVCIIGETTDKKTCCDINGVIHHVQNAALSELKLNPDILRMLGFETNDTMATFDMLDEDGNIKASATYTYDTQTLTVKNYDKGNSLVIHGIKFASTLCTLTRYCDVVISLNGMFYFKGFKSNA